MTFLHHFCLCVIACDCIKMTMTSVSVIARWRMRGKGKMQSRSPGRVVPAVLASRSTNTCYNTAYTNTNTQRQKYKYKYTNTKAKGRSVTQCLNNICSTSVNTSIFCYKFTLHFNIQIFCDCKFSTYNYNTMSTIIFQDHTIEDHTLQDHSIRK